MADEKTVGNYPQSESIQGIPVILDMPTVDDITIKNLQMTLVDAYEKSYDGKPEKEKYDEVSEAIYTVIQYLLPDANFEQFQFDCETMMNDIDEEKNGGETDDES
tara:strand:+ start:146 stop:460 length:315 start_codon:yes stop_codon:yes gene_type:complete